MDDYTKNTYAELYSAFDADQIEIIETDFPNKTILRMAHLTVRVSFLDDVVTYFTGVWKVTNFDGDAAVFYVKDFAEFGQGKACALAAAKAVLRCDAARLLKKFKNDILDSDPNIRFDPSSKTWVPRSDDNSVMAILDGKS